MPTFMPTIKQPYDHSHNGTRLKRHVSSCLLILSACLLLSAHTPASPVFTMAFGKDPKLDAQYSFYEHVYREAFRELGYRFTYKIFPSKRSSLNANRGIVDGEPQRVFSYGQKFTNLIRVEEPIFTNRTIAVSNMTTPNHSALQVNGPESLEGKNLRVDYIRGSVWSKTHLEPIIPEAYLLAVASTEMGLTRLEAGRSDILVALEPQLLKLLSLPERKNSSLKPIGVLGQNDSYPYLHNRHKELAPKLAGIIRQMKADGRYNQYLKQHMPFLFP